MIAIWMLINVLHPLAITIYPFILLNLALTIAAIQAPLIMMSQNQGSRL